MKMGGSIWTWDGPVAHPGPKMKLNLDEGPSPTWIMDRAQPGLYGDQPGYGQGPRNMQVFVAILAVERSN